MKTLFVDLLRTSSQEMADYGQWPSSVLLFWFFPVLGGVMLKLKDYYTLKSDNLEKRIDYAKIAGIV